MNDKGSISSAEVWIILLVFVFLPTELGVIFALLIFLYLPEKMEIHWFNKELEEKDNVSECDKKEN